MEIPNYAFRPITEQALRSNRTFPLARLFAALGFTRKGGIVNMKLGCLAICWVVGSVGNAANLNEKLKANLLCRNEPTKASSWLYLRVGETSSEGKVVSSGEEVEYRIDVQLNEPIYVEGAVTSAVTWQGEGDPDAFGAILVAEFEGDYEVVAARLKLVASGEKDTFKNVLFREIPNGTLCAPTILLKPVSKSRFKLGCGWCNGG